VERDKRGFRLKAIKKGIEGKDKEIEDEGESKIVDKGRRRGN
jgi:hypothetical protein